LVYDEKKNDDLLAIKGISKRRVGEKKSPVRFDRA